LASAYERRRKGKGEGAKDKGIERRKKREGKGKKILIFQILIFKTVT
jgi:hypothetical protein